MYVQDVDVSARTAIALCSCGWRQMLASPDRGAAWNLARAHAGHAHGGVDHATSRNASWWS